MQTDLILDEQPDLAVAAQPNTLVLRPGTAAVLTMTSPPAPCLHCEERCGSYEQ